MRITDSDGNRIGYVAYDLSDGETSATIVLTITPSTGFELTALPTDADVEAQARETGSGDPWVDIGATPIDLSSYTPETPVDFDFRLVAGSSLTGIRRVAIFLAVQSNGAAGWAN